MKWHIFPIIFFFGCTAGYLVAISLPNEPELFGKCEMNMGGAEERVSSGWDINTIQYFDHRPPVPVVLSAIFDHPCTSDSGLDADLAIFFLQNDGRLTVRNLVRIRELAKENNHEELYNYINHALEE